ncbi:hypothetical protein Pfo_015014 [Paulownia fortunei]|nr:hypothetical protein Pfo_015014 [Paulownia fortunei]
MTVHGTISTSSEVIGSIDDLLLQILLRLPVISLMRFKLVSKKWKSLITSPCFSLQYNSGPNPAVGMFYHGRKISAFEYIHLNLQTPTSSPFKELNFPEDPYPFWIQHSCNGLLLCCSSGNFDLDCRRHKSPIRRCYVYNPTTNCFTKLPRPGIVNGVPRFVCGVTLAFDPAKSSPYKVVCVRGSEFAPDLCQIEIYSTESGEWRVSGEPFRAEVNFGHGVYWNGSVHWISNKTREVLFFDVDQERLGKIALPAVADGHELSGVRYFGESCDHLHLIRSYDTEIKLIVYEKKRDHPDWFAKYRVDLTTVAAAFPEMASVDDFTGWISYAFTIFFLVQGKNESAFLVMQICRKVVRFDLQCNTFEEIHEFGDAVAECPSRAFEYIESLHMFPVPTSC